MLFVAAALLALGVDVYVSGAGTKAPFGLSGVLRLQDHARISHDTYYLSRRPHPHNRKRLVHGYAFLNLHRSALGAAPQAGAAAATSGAGGGSDASLVRRDKHHHFQRNLTTHESRNKSRTDVQSVAAAAAHGKKKHAHNTRARNVRENDADDELPSCTGPISDGTGWRTSRGYRIHTQNRNGLSSAFVVDAVQRANDAWHCGTAAFEKLVEGPLLQVIDNSSGATINLDGPDGVNEVGFASIQGHPGTVAVTVVWGTFDGPLEQREIIEYDMVFDGEHYEFGDATVNPHVMHLPKIALHETGHSYGLDDIYDGACKGVTMFGTSVEGETDGSELTANDLDGLSLLYGPLAPTE